MLPYIVMYFTSHFYMGLAGTFMYLSPEFFDRFWWNSLQGTQFV